MAKEKGLLSRNISEFTGHVDVRNLTLFCRQLSTLLNVGLPLLRALNVLSDRTSNLVMRRKIKGLAEQVEKGKSFSAALMEERGIFDDFFVNTVRAGEEGGILQKTLHLMADYLEKDRNIRHRMKSVLLYPGITLGFSFIVLAFILMVVIPKFQDAYKMTNIQALPTPTVVVIAVSNFLNLYFWWLLAGLGSVLFLFWLWTKTSMGRSVLDWLSLRLPVAGTLQQNILLYRLARLMHLLLESGVSVQRAIEISAKASGNLQVQHPLLAIAQSITSGRSVEASFREHRFFPELFVDMIGIGEETGAIGSVMNKLSQTFEEEVESSLTNIGMLLEPIMVMIVGAIVVLIAVAIFVPYLGMSEALLKGS